MSSVSFCAFVIAALSWSPKASGEGFNGQDSITF